MHSWANAMPNLNGNLLPAATELQRLLRLWFFQLQNELVAVQVFGLGQMNFGMLNKNNKIFQLNFLELPTSLILPCSTSQTIMKSMHKG